MVPGASEGIDWTLSCFVFFLVTWGFLEYFKFEKEGGVFGRTKSHPAVEAWEATGRQGKCCRAHCRRHHRPRALRIVCVQGTTGRTSARTASPEQEPGEVSLGLGVTRSERGPHGTCLRAANIIGAVDSARREALVREVPLAEELAESATKERQCERNLWSKERDECAIRATAAGSWPEVE